MLRLTINLSLLKKTLLVGVFIVISILCTALSVNADEVIIQEEGALTSPPPEEYQRDGLYIKQEEINTTTNSFIFDAWNQISYNEPIIRISGSTLTNQFVEELTISIFIQRWDGTRWNTVMFGGTASGENRTSLSASQSFIVTPGYYYRGMTVHTARNGFIEDRETRYTNFVLAPK